jgi:3-hydroxyacyl-[acyl-carrier-protein] dehydratase
MSFWNGIDTIVVMENGRRAQALCNVPCTLEVFNTHFPRFPVLPGVLILESMSQLAATLLAETGKPWRLQKASQVRFRHFVQPGSQMKIEVEMKHLSNTTALLKGVVTVACDRGLAGSRTGASPVPTALQAQEGQRIMTTVRELRFVTNLEAEQAQDTEQAQDIGSVQGTIPTGYPGEEKR